MGKFPFLGARDLACDESVIRSRLGKASSKNFLLGRRPRRLSQPFCAYLLKPAPAVRHEAWMIRACRHRLTGEARRACSHQLQLAGHGQAARRTGRPPAGAPATGRSIANRLHDFGVMTSLFSQTAQDSGENSSAHTHRAAPTAHRRNAFAAACWARRGGAGCVGHGAPRWGFSPRRHFEQVLSFAFRPSTASRVVHGRDFSELALGRRHLLENGETLLDPLARSLGHVAVQEALQTVGLRRDLGSGLGAPLADVGHLQAP